MAIPAFVFVAVLSLLVSVQAAEVKWCLKSADEAATCATMVAIFNRLEQNNHTWSCYQSDGPEGCVTALNNGDATLVALDGGDIYDAATGAGIQVVAQEDNSLGGKSYYAVAVVRSSECSSGTTLADFKGKNTCHTGYRRSAGWSLPVYSIVVNRTLVPKVNVDATINNDIESIEAYFGDVCAPGSEESGKVCTLCPTQCDAETSTYVGYPGTVNCMMNGGGDIAFTKNGVAEQYASDGISAQAWSSLSASEMMLLCPDGGCAELSAFTTCNYGSVIGHAIVTGVSTTQPIIDDILAVFTAANSDSGFTSRFLTGNNTDEHIFLASTTRLSTVSPATAEVYLGDEYATYRDVTGLDTTVELGTASKGTSGTLVTFLSLVSALVAVMWLV